MSPFERFPVQKKRDEFEDSGSAGKGVRRSREEIRQARDAKRNGEAGEVIAALPVPEALETHEEFDPIAYFEFAKQAYIELGKKIKAMGIEPREVPAWEAADATLDQIKLLSNEYAAEPVLTKRKKIARDMEILGANFLSREKMGWEIEDSAREIRNERKDREDQKIPKGTPKEEAFGSLVSDILKNIPEVQEQHQYTERLAELTSVFGDTPIPPEVAELYKKLEDPKNRAAYLEYIRKARAGVKRARQEQQEGFVAAQVVEEPLIQVETRPELLTADSEGTSKEWRERLHRLISQHRAPEQPGDTDETERA